ncbi:glycosyltransferase family 4 protein [Candidatus Bathyarchaeota archaeon]|nr:glycosyltransferase family 4 protein [Candidatus Bathyarchaeota archaeon]
MKVLMICPSLTPRLGGGIASVVNNIVKFTHQKVDYTLVSKYDRSELQEIRDLYPFPVKIVLVKEFSEYVSMFLSRRIDFEIIHFHGMNRLSLFPILARLSRGFRGSIIYSHHIAIDQLMSGAKLVCARVLFEMVSPTWEKVIVNSRFCADELSRSNRLANRTIVIPNGIDVGSVERVLPLSLEGDPAIVYVGHLIKLKGIDILLKAFSSLAHKSEAVNAHLHVVGSGDLDKACKNYAKRIGLSNRIHFWGPTSHDHALRILRGSDMFVLPSRYENSPIVLLEAMAAAKPIIATNVGGIPEVAKDGVNGILVRPSISEMSKAVLYLIRNKKLAKNMSFNNSRDVRVFSWENIAHKYVSLYEDAKN